MAIARYSSGSVAMRYRPMYTSGFVDDVMDPTTACREHFLVWFCPHFLSSDLLRTGLHALPAPLFRGWVRWNDITDP